MTETELLATPRRSFTVSFVHVGLYGNTQPLLTLVAHSTFSFTLHTNSSRKKKKNYRNGKQARLGSLFPSQTPQDYHKFLPAKVRSRREHGPFHLTFSSS